MPEHIGKRDEQKVGRHHVCRLAIGLAVGYRHKVEVDGFAHSVRLQLPSAHQGERELELRTLYSAQARMHRLGRCALPDNLVKDDKLISESKLLGKRESIGFPMPITMLEVQAARLAGRGHQSQASDIGGRTHA